MSFKDFIAKNYTKVSMLSSIGVAGVVSTVAYAPLGLFGLVAGGLSGMACFTASELISRKSQNEILLRQLNGTDDKEKLLALIGANTNPINEIESQKQSQLRRLRGMISEIMERKATFGDLLEPVTEFLEKCIKLSGADNAFNNNPLDLVRFENIIEEEFPRTLEVFYNSSDPANDKELRSKFLEQVFLLDSAVSSFIENINKDRNDALDINGNYLRSKYKHLNDA